MSTLSLQSVRSLGTYGEACCLLGRLLFVNWHAVDSGTCVPPSPGVSPPQSSMNMPEPHMINGEEEDLYQVATMIDHLR